MRRLGVQLLVVLLGGLLTLATAMVAMMRSSPDPLPGGATQQASPRSTAHSTPLRAQLAAQPRFLYRMDFAEYPVGPKLPAGWEVVDGTWTGVVKDGGNVLQHATGRSFGRLVTGSPGWSSYDMAADVKVTPLSTGFAGIMGRYQTPDDYYECVIHHAVSVQLWRLHNGVGMELGGQQVDIDTQRFHRLELNMQGGRLACMLDGVTMAAAPDRMFSVGRIGLVASNGEAAEFDNIDVTTWPVPP